jgi:hypothetical protein
MIAATEAQFPPNVKANHDAPRAGSGENVNSNKFQVFLED